MTHKMLLLFPLIFFASLLLVFPFAYSLQVKKSLALTWVANFNWAAGFIRLKVEPENTIMLRLLLYSFWILPIKLHKPITPDFFIALKSWLYLIKIAAAIQPQELRVTVRYGTADPYYTGIIYGFVNSAKFLLPNKYKICLVPTFECETLSGEIFASGRITLVKVMYLACKQYLTPKYKKFVNQLKNRRAYVTQS